MVYGYARVSTDGQKRKGTSLEEQTKELQEAGAEKIVVDHYTGTKVNDRPEFGKLLKELKEGDTLLVCKLDRFARSAVEGNQVLRELLNRGVSVHILNMGLVDNTPIGKLIATIFLGFAEFERDMIVERTSSGREARRREAEARGETFIDFRPRVMDDKQIAHAMELLDTGKTYKEVCDLLKVSKSTLIRRRREQRAEQIQKQMEEQEQSAEIIPRNICDALYETDATVYSYLYDHPEYARTLEKDLQEISILTERISDCITGQGEFEDECRQSEQFRKVRDLSLDKLAAKVRQQMAKTIVVNGKYNPHEFDPSKMKPLKIVFK